MNILEKITSLSKIELIETKKYKSFSDLEREVAFVEDRASFSASFKGRGGTKRVIAELKKASPSKGLIRKDFDPVSLAISLESGGAAALSVLTEKNFFMGSKENLKRVSEATHLPLLRKDFIYDPYQIYEAKILGASAVLLIAAMLDKNEFNDLVSCAHSLGLDVLGEAHDEAELERVLLSGAELAGVNARNLKTFETSPERCAELLSMIPDDRTGIAESAIRTKRDMEILEQSGAKGFLIGETLMRASDPRIELERLIS